MKKFIGSLLMVVAASGAFAEGDAKAGKAKSSVCAACHGADGNSPAPNFPSIAGQNVKYLVKQLQDMKLKPEEGGRMVAEMSGIVAGLSDQDIEDLAAFYAEQTPKGGAADPELVTKGESVYRSGNLEKGLAACTGCHGPAGKGNKGAGYPALSGQHSDYIAKQLKAFRLGSEEPQSQGARLNDGDTKIMRDIAARMSDLEIKAVSSFISGLR